MFFAVRKQQTDAALKLLERRLTYVFQASSTTCTDLRVQASSTLVLGSIRRLEGGQKRYQKTISTGSPPMIW
jgi:hypothetical protein